MSVKTIKQLVNFHEGVHPDDLRKSWISYWNHHPERFQWHDAQIAREKKLGGRDAAFVGAVKVDPNSYSLLGFTAECDKPSAGDLMPQSVEALLGFLSSCCGITVLRIVWIAASKTVLVQFDSHGGSMRAAEEVSLQWYASEAGASADKWGALGSNNERGAASRDGANGGRTAVDLPNVKDAVDIHARLAQYYMKQKSLVKGMPQWHRAERTSHSTLELRPGTAEVARLFNSSSTILVVFKAFGPHAVHIADNGHRVLVQFRFASDCVSALEAVQSSLIADWKVGCWLTAEDVDGSGFRRSRRPSPPRTERSLSPLYRPKRQREREQPSSRGLRDRSSRSASPRRRGPRD